MSAEEKPQQAAKQDEEPRATPTTPAPRHPSSTSDTAAPPGVPRLRLADDASRLNAQDAPVEDDAGSFLSDERAGSVVIRGYMPGALRPYRPHITERPLRRIDAFYLPRARARIAIVIVTGKSGPTPVGPDGRPAKGEIFWRGGTLYEIDLGLHHTTVELDLPAKGDSCDFHLTAHVEWRVEQPAKVVLDNLPDIREALGIALRIQLSEITRGYDVSQITAAEAAVRDALSPTDLGRAYGLRTQMVARLTSDEKSQAYISARRELEREKEIEDLRHRNTQVQEYHEQERQRARMAEYRRIVASGNVDQFALQLARKPEDVADVVKLAREERYEERKQFTELVARLVQSGAISRWEVDDQVRLVLEWLAESTERVMRSDVAIVTEQRNAQDTANDTGQNGAMNGSAPAH